MDPGGQISERLKIVQVNAFHYPYRGGIEHRIHHISKRLIKDHDVTVLTSQLPDTKTDEIIDGYAVKRLPSRFIDIYNPPYVATPGLEEALAALKPDVVDFHYRWAPTYNKLARRYSGKKVFTFHNTYGEGVGITRLPSLLNDRLWKSHLDKFDRIVCVSEFVRADLERRGVDGSRLVAIPNGIELVYHNDVPKEEDFILFVGRLVNTKGLPYLIRAMKDVDTRLIICGGGPEEKGLRKLVQKLDLQGKVDLAGKVSEERKVQLMSTCKLFVMPSIFESYGIAVAEAMSYGKAIVATRIGGLPEVVSDAGLLAEAKDPGDLASKIDQLLRNDVQRKEMAAKALAYSKGYGWDTIAQSMDQVYRSVVIRSA